MPTINKPKKNYNKNRNTEKRKLRMKVYQSKRWNDIKNAHLMQYPVCQVCNKELAEDVHHIVTFLIDNSIDLDKAYNPDNLMSVCKSCHGKLHSSNIRNDKKLYKDS